MDNSYYHITNGNYMDKYLSNRLKKVDSSRIREMLSTPKHNAIDLSIGYPAGTTPPTIKLAAIRAIESNKTTYTPTEGIAELRAKIADKLASFNGIDGEPDNVIITPGATTALLMTYLAVINPGDEVLIPEPYFPPHKDVAEMLGAKVKLINTAPDFRLSAKTFENIISPKTKLLVINTPHNPTGTVYTQSELTKIARVAKKYGILIISDEVYEMFTYSKPHFSIGSIYPSTLTINSFSKSYSMTGWRIGYIHGPETIISAISEIQQYTVFSSSSIAQYASLSVPYISRKGIVDKYIRKRDLVISALEPILGPISGGEGAFYLFLHLPKSLTDETVVHRLAETGVLVLPGCVFGRTHDYIRLSYGASLPELRKGLNKIITAINKL